MNRSKHVLVLSFFTFIATLMLSSCGEKKQKEQDVPKVRMVTVQTSLSMGKNSFPGRTKASETSSVAFKVSGTLASVPVKIGQHVSKGQVLARMDTRDYEVQLNAIKAEYESIKAECERVIALYKDKGTSQNNYDKARYGLEQITMKYKHAKDELSDCVIRAPFDGYVQAVLHEAYETIGAGMPVVTLFTSGGTEVVINIPAAEYQRVNDFAKFKASFDVLRDETFDLRLLNISQRANASQLYEVHLLIEKADKRITPGMTAMVDVFYKENGELPVEIPAAAVFEIDNRSHVYVYDAASGTLHKREIRVAALQSDGYVRVVKGLKAGEKIAALGVHMLKDGQKVKPAVNVSKTNIGGLL